MRKALLAAGCTLAAVALQTTPALACGGLVAPDGDVRLDKATTFVAWRDGIEHYVTSFAYEGKAVDVGWIVPLPAVPEKIEQAGKWTLQRLEREVNPPRELNFADASAGAPSAAVIEHVQVEALDVTILKGSGKEVVTWCAHNGFALNEETRDHLMHYAEGTPIFMAAKYNASTAQQRGLAQGDGVPLQMTMRTPRLWVPLEVLANDDTNVNADIFLLTDNQLTTADHPFGWPFLPTFGETSVGAPGFVAARQELMNDALHRDLSGDRNMQWVPSSGWLTYLTLHAPSSTVTYDLSVAGDNVIRLPEFGGVTSTSTAKPASAPLVIPIASAAGALALILVAGWLVTLRRHRKSVALRAL